MGCTSGRGRWCLVPIGAFVPQYIAQSELSQFGLPSATDQCDIMNLVQLASLIIDERCGRIDDDGRGSLVYTTYTQRILLPTRGKNLILIPLKPIVGLDQATVTALDVAAAASGNYYATGVIPNSIIGPNGVLSGIVSCSGRYGYTRQDRSIGYPDLYAMINPLNLVTMFGGPAPWVALDVSMIDYDAKTGEAWLPAGLQLQAYSEVIVTYNVGYNPLQMPFQIKQVCAAVVKNALSKGAGTTGLLSLSVSRSGLNVQMHEDLIDPVLDRFLTPFKNVRAI